MISLNPILPDPYQDASMWLLQTKLDCRHTLDGPLKKPMEKTFIRESITVLLTSCFTCFDSAGLLAYVKLSTEIQFSQTVILPLTK